MSAGNTGAVIAVVGIAFTGFVLVGASVMHLKRRRELLLNRMRRSNLQVRHLLKPLWVGCQIWQ